MQSHVLALKYTCAIGETMEGAVRLKLRPVNGLIWSVDKCADWVLDAISKKFEEQNIQK